METVAWVGALETAIAILYLALIGQRSVAQWLDDRQKRRSPTTTQTADQAVKQEPKAEASSPLMPSRKRSLSVQSVGDYIEYVWRDPAKAALVTSRVLTIGGSLLFGASTLLLLLSALITSAAALFSGSKELGQVAQRMTEGGGTTAFLLFVSVFLAYFAVVGNQGFDEYRQEEQERRELAERKARTQRRRTVQK